MDFMFEKDKSYTPNNYKRIVLRVVKQNLTCSVSIIDDTQEALQIEANYGAHAVSWFRFKTSDYANEPVIYEGDFIIPFTIVYPNLIDKMTTEQHLVYQGQSDSNIVRQASGSPKLKDPERIVEKVLEFAKWLQQKYGFSDNDLKLLLNKQWGWIGLIIPARLLGTHDGGQGLPAVYQKLGQRFYNRYRASLTKGSLTTIEQSRYILDKLKTNMESGHQNESIRDDSLRALSAVWLDLRGNQKLFDLASFNPTSCLQSDNYNGDSAHQILYGQTSLPKTPQSTKIAWEIISTINQLAKQNNLSSELPILQHLFALRSQSHKWLQKLGVTFLPSNFYQCPAFSQMPLQEVLSESHLRLLDVLKLDEVKLLTHFRSGHLLELNCSCQAIKKHFDCGNDCGIDSPFTLAFRPEIDLRKKIVQTAIKDFDERDGILYHQKRRGKKLIEETRLCPVISTIALQKGGKSTGDILLRQGDAAVATVVTSGELRPANARALWANLTRNHLQLESSDLKIVKLIQKYLRLPCQSQYNGPRNLYKVLSSEPRRKKGVNVRHGSGEEAAHGCV